MRVAIIHSTYGKVQISDTDFIPRVGDRVGLWHRPFPTVHEVIAFPSEDLLKELGIKSSGVGLVEVIIFVH